MPARSVCLVALSLSEAGPGRFGRQVSVTGIYHTIPYRPLEYAVLLAPLRSVQFSRSLLTQFSSVQFSSVQFTLQKCNIMIGVSHKGCVTA